MRKRLTVAFLCAVLAGTMLVAVPAQAINEWLCDGVPSAGFSDVSISSPHYNDINCLAYWDITTQVGTYDPFGSVSRWQMALFLTRTVPPFYQDASGAYQGFTDIGALPVSTQVAINQVKQFAITSGTTATTFSPNDVVTRWQMALFLVRFVYAFGAGIPDGSAQGFTDIGSLSAEAQTAINQAKQLGITSGTSATTYSPNAPVTREQMARKLITETFYSTPDCTPPFPADPADYVPGITVCRGEGNDFENDPFILMASYIWVGPFDTVANEQDFNASGAEMYIDGVQQNVAARIVTLNGILYRHYVLTVPGLSGTHDIEIRWFSGGTLDYTTIATITYDIPVG
jgi:hypothetical protein